MNKKISLAPFAVASDGTVFANMGHVRGDVAVTKILQEVRRMDGVLFIGIAVTPAERRALRLTIDNAGTEAVATARRAW